MKGTDYTTMYVIEYGEICEYPIKETIDGAYNRGSVVKYYVKRSEDGAEDRIHSYTEGSRSYEIGQRFQINPVNCVLSYYKIYGETNAYNAVENNSNLRNFINKVKNDYPEYFI